MKSIVFPSVFQVCKRFKRSNNNKGQSMLEALFVVVFTTVIMFAFIQICIMTVDDMIANEAAFVAMRSAAVTKSKFRA
jgi:Tfp pilus assembly protein PilV